MSDMKSALNGTTNEIRVLSEAEALDLPSIISRWSSTGVAPPHSIVTPTTAEDIIAVIQFARLNKLKIIPAGGGHSPFTPITNDTIYLSMTKFKNIKLDETSGDVTFGGGVLTGEVLKHLGHRGWYTCVPNSNSVGLVGALLGGMHHLTIGLHGLGMQNIKEVTIIPFSLPNGSTPTEITISQKSGNKEERDLFSVLAGAGFGFGVITSLKLAAWPISALRATSDQVWTRTLIFPPGAISAAVRATLALCTPAPALRRILVFARAPPGAPRPGAPMIILAISYFGPKQEAEKIVDGAIPKDALDQAMNVVTGAVNFANINVPYAAMNNHDGYKEFEGGFLEEFDEAGLKEVLELFLKYTDANMASRAGSSCLLSCWNPEQVRAKVGDESDSLASQSGERAFFVQATPWYATPEEAEEAGIFAREAYEAFATNDRSNGRRKWGFASNVRIGADMGEVYSKEQIARIETVKATWDRDSVGWSPVVDGW